MTSSKKSESNDTRCSGSKRYTWNGFSKSAGALGVITNAVPSGAQYARELDHVQRGVHEVLDDVRRDREVDAAVAQADAPRRRSARNSRPAIPDAIGS